jgi:hypothetical protein
MKNSSDNQVGCSDYSSRRVLPEPQARSCRRCWLHMRWTTTHFARARARPCDLFVLPLCASPTSPNVVQASSSICSSQQAIREDHTTGKHASTAPFSRSPLIPTTLCRLKLPRSVRSPYSRD